MRNLQADLDRLTADRESGASELLSAAVAILREGRKGDRTALGGIAAAVCRAQPSMAPIWVAAGLSLHQDEGAFETFAARAARAPGIVARIGSELLAPDEAARAVRVVTCSFSATVLATLLALASRHRLEVALAEGRPALEGRRLAAALAGAGVTVSYFTDAALGDQLEGADTILMGADIVSPLGVLNKSGSAALAAMADAIGVPVYIAAGREKFLPVPLVPVVSVRRGRPAEVWADAPPGVTVRVPYFGWVPLRLVTALVTDVGIIAVDSVGDVCSGVERQLGPESMAFLRGVTVASREVSSELKAPRAMSKRTPQGSDRH